MLLLQNNLMIAIVNKGQARRFVDIARKAGTGGGTVIPARGTATGNFLRFLGLGDTSKEMILMVIEKDLADKIVEVREPSHSQQTAISKLTVKILQIILRPLYSVKTKR
ncbi:MAG: hypothetical protein II903_03775 [Spirochaetales bacterium]|nr:hypothetical protein [Spirochaetales bacterium]